MVMVPQLLMLTGRGATKSLTSAGKEADERLFRKPLANASQVLPKTPAAVRLTAASPKVSPGRLTPAIGSSTVEVLTAPSANPAAVRLSVLGPVVVRFGWVFWLISKSMLAEPSTFDRSQARYR